MREKRPNKGHGSKAGYTSGWLGSTPEGRRPQIPRLPRWGLAGCRQLDPSHPAGNIETRRHLDKLTEQLASIRAERNAKGLSRP